MKKSSFLSWQSLKKYGLLIIFALIVFVILLFNFVIESPYNSFILSIAISLSIVVLFFKIFGIGKKPLWFKLGVIFFIPSFLIIGYVSYNEYKQCSPDWKSMCGFATGIFNLPMSAFFTNNPSLSHFYDSIPHYASSTMLVILSSIFWFLVGALIGFIIQKVKSKK